MFIRKEELTKEEIESLSTMALENCQLKHVSEVVVRGGIISCIAGSHYRYLNMPYSHGVMVKGAPIALVSDCVVGENICDFGICAIKTILATSRSNFKKTGDIIGMVKKNAIIEGIPCTPVPLGEWLDGDENSQVFTEHLTLENKLLSDSTLPCLYGEKMIINESGQVRLWELWKDIDTLEDHDICKIKVNEGDALQISVLQNTVEVSLYYKINGATDAQKKLVRDGIKQWEFKYDDLAFGHEPSVAMKLYEKEDSKQWPDNQKYFIIEFMPKEKCLKEDLTKRTKAEIGELLRSETHNKLVEGNWDYGNSVVNFYPIHPINAFDDNDHFDTKDGKKLYVVRQLTDKEMTNVITHEIGHVMGLMDIKNGIIPTNYRLHGTYGDEDIMATVRYEKDIKIFALNIEMIITAAFTHEFQYYDDYSLKELIYKRKKKCRNEKK